jgi:hypothetical protein
MSRLIEILGFVPVGGIVLFLGREGVAFELFFAFVFIHNLFDASLHHAEILFGIDMLGFGFVRHVVNLADVALLLLVTLEAVVYACGRPGRLVEEALEAHGVGVDCVLVLVLAGQHRDGVGVVVKGEVVPTIGTKS